MIFQTGIRFKQPPDPVLHRVAIAVMQYHNQNQLEEARVYLAYISTLLFISEGTQDWNSNRVYPGGRELMQRP